MSITEIDEPLAPGACCDTAPCTCQDAPIDRLPEIQARAAKARAGSHDVDWLIREVVRLRAENQTLGTEKGLLEERFAELVAELDKLRATQGLAASLTERLAALQDGNEGAYRELYDAMNGPHFCADRPFGQTAAAEQVTA